MTDRDDAPIDLRGLNAQNDPAETERMIQAAMTRIRKIDRVGRTDTVWDVVSLFPVRLSPAAIAALAVLLLIGATALLATTPEADRRNVTIEARVLDWVNAGHVPTNGDLVATFAGMQR